MRRRPVLPDTLLGLAVCLLLLVVASRAALRLLAPEPVRAREVLGTEPTRYPRGRLLLLADSADVRWPGDAGVAARRTQSELPLDLVVPGPGDEVRRLVRAYGVEHLPVLLTLDAEARVLRVEPLSTKSPPSGS